MKLNIQLFAGARDRIGQSVIAVDLADGATAGELRERLSCEFPELRPIARGAMIAVDTDYASDDTVLRSTNEIALIPPVSGG